MIRSLTNKVVAIPLAVSATGAAVGRMLIADGGGLALGASSSAQFKALEAEIDGRQGVYCQQVDLDRPKSVAQFFEIAYAQFGRLDVVVVETIPSPSRRSNPEQQIEMATRRLLHCFDAALQYAEDELHIINVAPVVRGIAMPVGAAFLGAKLATTRLPSIPRVRMSIVSPSNEHDWQDASLARTVLHVMRESRSPDITEMVLPRQAEKRRANVKQHGSRPKMWAHI